MPEEIEVYVWPDGVWCEKEELEEYLTYKSDDFMVKSFIDDGIADLEDQVQAFMEMINT